MTGGSVTTLTVGALVALGAAGAPDTAAAWYVTAALAAALAAAAT